MIENCPNCDVANAKELPICDAEENPYACLMCGNVFLPGVDEMY